MWFHFWRILSGKQTKQERAHLMCGSMFFFIVFREKCHLEFHVRESCISSFSRADAHAHFVWSKTIAMWLCSVQFHFHLFPHISSHSQISLHFFGFCFFFGQASEYFKYFRFVSFAVEHGNISQRNKIFFEWFYCRKISFSAWFVSG